MAEDTAVANDPIELARRRMRFRCWHRGTKELDLLMGPFADRNIDAMSGPQLAELERLLMLPDLDLYNWITRQAPVPEDQACEVLDRIIEFHHRS